ncbi:HlyD family secretion protein [Aeromonas jandaei]
MFIGSIKPRKNNEKQLLAICLIVAAFLFVTILMTGRYADKIDVQGEIKRNNSVMIYAENSGIVDKVYKAVGGQVTKGELLFKISNNSSNYSSDSELSSVKQRLDALYDLIDAEKNNFNSVKRDKEKEIDSTLKRISITSTELNKLKLGLELVKKDITILESKASRFNKLVKAGAISLDTYNDVVMKLQQRLGDKNRFDIEIITKSKEIIEYNVSIDRAHTSIREAETTYQRQLEALNDRRLSLEKSEFYYIYAPASGVISYSSVNEYQAIRDGEQLGTISNSVDSELFVELYTDSRAMSYLGLNREVVIRVDAFPYEKFGVLKGHVLSVSPAKMKNTSDKNMFNVKVKIINIEQIRNIEISWLKDGMTISATYSGPELSLIEWLFLPVLKGVKRNPDFWSKSQ